MPLLLLLAVGCGGAVGHRSTLPREPIAMEELHITATAHDDGSVAVESYDAGTLFDRANALVESGHCDEALPLYARIADEFSSSRFASPGLYNAGLCLHRDGKRIESADVFGRLVRTMPDTIDAKHALFHLAELDLDLGRWDDGIAVTERLLARDDLRSDERVEAMARRAQSLLGANRVSDAARSANETLTYFRTRRGDEQVADEFFAAAANYVLAETLRLRSAAIEIPQAEVTEQRRVLERRAQLLLDAQREYFNTIRHTNAHWAAAAGYRIGAMYDDFWDAVMRAPTPPPRNPIPAGGEALYEEEYRLSLQRLVKPLLRHAIRYWELTLMMIERTGVETEWTDRTRADLDRARTRLLEQPTGPEGIQRAPAAGTAPEPPSSDPT